MKKVSVPLVVINNFSGPIDASVFESLVKVLGGEPHIIEGLKLVPASPNTFKLTRGSSYLNTKLLVMDTEIEVPKPDFFPAQLVAYHQGNQLIVEWEPLQPIENNAARLWILDSFCLDDNLCIKYQYTPYLWDGYSRSINRKALRLVINDYQIDKATAYFLEDPPNSELYCNGLRLYANKDFSLKCKPYHEVTKCEISFATKRFQSDVITVAEFVKLCTSELFSRRRFASSGRVILFHQSYSTASLPSYYSQRKTHIL